MSIILASLLIGVGYKAYVVIGTAPKEITSLNQCEMDCPFPTYMDENESDDDPLLDDDEA